MGNCVSNEEPYSNIQPEQKVPINTEYIFNSLIEQNNNKFFYYVQGVDIKKLQSPNTLWSRDTSLGNTLECLEENESKTFAIICFNKKISAEEDLLNSYLGHCLCKKCETLELEQNVGTDNIPVKKISDSIRALPNVYIEYLDTNKKNKKNKILHVGSDIINILQTNVFLQQQFKYHYIHLDSILLAYTFYIQNKFENIAIDNFSKNKQLVQYPALWDFGKDEEGQISYYFNKNEFMNAVDFGIDRSKDDILNYSKESIKDGIYLGEPRTSTDFSLIGCICFLSSMKRDDIYIPENMTFITKEPTKQTGGIEKEKILFKGYYFTVRNDRYGKYIYSKRIGRVSKAKVMRAS